MVRYPASLAKLIEVFRKLPGVGTKGAERYAFHLIEVPDQTIGEMVQAISQAKEQLKKCSTCGCLIGRMHCDFCDPRMRKTHQLCILAAVKDVFVLEATNEYEGTYHVLGGLLSPIEGYHPENLFLHTLRERIEKLAVKEVIIALDATLEGDATAFYLKRELENLPVKISRLAFGLPIGSSFEFVDGGTLARAFSGRSQF